MELYSVVETPKTPGIIFNPYTGVLEMKGRSIPENTTEFYRPLIEAIDKYATTFQPKTTVNIHMEYFNTSSSKSMLNIFKKLEVISKSGSMVTVNWFYEENDDDMLEAGEDFQVAVSLPFKMVQITE